MARLFNGSSDQAVGNQDLSAFTTLTVSFWMWVNAYTNGNKFAAIYSLSGSSFQNGIVIRPDDSGGNFDFGMSKGGTFWLDNFTRPSAAAWHHYLMTFDRINDVNQCWVDGFAQTLTTNLHQPMGNALDNTNWTFFMYPSLFLAGRLTEWATWGGLLLGQTEATALANKGLPPAVHPTGLTSYYGDMQQSPAVDVSGAGAGSIAFTGTQSTRSPIYTLLGQPPAMPPIVRGHPAMRRDRAFFLSRPPVGVTDTIAPTLAGTSSLTATVTRYQKIVVALSGAGSLSATLTPYKRLTVALTGSGQLAATLTPYKRIVPALAGSSSLSAAVTPYKRLTVALAGSGSLTATITPLQRITVALSGSGALAATVTPYQRLTVTLAGSSSLTATITPYQQIAPALSGTSTLSAAISNYQTIPVTLAGKGSLTSTLTPYRPLTVALTGTSTLSATVSEIGPMPPTTTGAAGATRRKVRLTDMRHRQEDELLILLSAAL